MAGGIRIAKLASCMRSVQCTRFRLERPTTMAYHACRQGRSAPRNKLVGQVGTPSTFGEFSLQFYVRRSSGGDCRAASAVATDA